MSKGSQLIVSRIVRTTSQRFSVIDQPNAFFKSQYSPATTVAKKGGLLE